MSRRTEQERERLLALAERPVPAGGVGPRVVKLPRNLLCVDPADYTCSRLAAQLADEWVEYVAATEITGQAKTYQQAISTLCRHVDKAFGSAAPQVGLGDPSLLDVLTAWEIALPEAFRPGSTRPAMLMSAIRVLIVRRAEHRERAVDPVLERFAGGFNLIGPGETTERDEFKRDEKLALVQAAWRSAHATRKRLDDGWALAATGRHPDEGSWTSVPDLLWGLAHDQITPSEIRDNLPRPRHWPAELHALAAEGGTVRPQLARVTLCRRLIAQLHPGSIELHAFRVLLIDATGHASEEVTSFGEAHVEFLPNGVRLTMLKLRGKVLRHRAFRDQDDDADAGQQVGEQQDVVEVVDAPRREASAVVRQLLEVTARTRARAPQVTDTLFVRAALQRGYILAFGPWSPDSRGHAFHDWVAAQGVEITGDVHIGRLRKSTKVEKAIVTGGSISATADDHTEETFAGHYAQGTTLRILSGRTIATAQQHWFDQALSRVDGPTVVEGDVDSGRLQESGLSAQEAAEIMNGELDMGVSHCRSPRQSPYGRPGELCPVAPLSCLECGNAWILPSNLPQLLLFKAHVDKVRTRLPPEVFDRLWGQRWRNLHAVLEARTDTELTQAQRHIDAGQAVLDLPLNAYTEFDA